MTDSETSSRQHQPVTVGVPQDRVAEFHAFFARFLAAPRGRGRGAGRVRPHGGRRGHGHGPHCAGRRETSDRSEPAPASTEL